MEGSECTVYNFWTLFSCYIQQKVFVKLCSYITFWGERELKENALLGSTFIGLIEITTWWKTEGPILGWILLTENPQEHLMWHVNMKHKIVICFQPSCKGEGCSLKSTLDDVLLVELCNCIFIVEMTSSHRCLYYLFLW